MENSKTAYIYSVNPLDSANGKWDYGLLNEIFEKNNVDQIVVDNIPKADRAFVVIPGGGNAGKEKIISEQISNIDRVVLFITGDESGLFNVDSISHPNISIWIQYPQKKHSKYNRFFVGVPQHLKKDLPDYPQKIYDVFFSGQITHSRRRQLAEVMPSIPNSLYNPTRGFAQGYEPKEYYQNMSLSRIAPCPAGAVVVDSFRFFEAIELLCLPIGDLIDSQNNQFDFFQYVAGINLIKKVSDWNTLPQILPEILNEYPNNMHQIVCWWIKYKRDLGIKIMGSLYE